jgi:hypothetical protein
MAFAIRCDELLRTGKVRDLEHLAISIRRLHTPMQLT